MSSRRERKARANDTSPLGRLRNGRCPRCGEKAAHFVGPSFGDPGFYTCEAPTQPESSSEGGGKGHPEAPVIRGYP